MSGGTRIEALILDDLGHVQQSREEMEVLFTLVAERYEPRSPLITIQERTERAAAAPATWHHGRRSRPHLGEIFTKKYSEGSL